MRWNNCDEKKTKKKKSNLEELYAEMLKENDPMMKHLKRQIEEAKLPEQSFESTYITGKVKR